MHKIAEFKLKELNQWIQEEGLDDPNSPISIRQGMFLVQKFWNPIELENYQIKIK